MNETIIEGPLYAARKKVYPQAVRGRFRRIKWAILGVTLAIYYLLPFVRRHGHPRPAEPGRADRFPASTVLFLLHRAVAAGGLLFHWPADHRRDDLVSDERRGRPGLVRVHVPADDLDGSQSEKR